MAPSFAWKEKKSQSRLLDHVPRRAMPRGGGVPRANKTSTYSSLPPFRYASSPSNLKSLPPSSNKLLQHNKMIIYEDVHCGDEMISDAFDLSVMIGLVPLNQKRSEFID